jgi:hypothetical protein
MGFMLVLESGATQAGPAETGSTGSGISVFGTIHPDIFRLRVPIGSGGSMDRVQVASLAPQIRFDAPADAGEMAADTSVLPCRNGSDDCPASFDDRFKSAMPVLASSLRSASDRELQIERAVATKPTVSRTYLSTGQTRKEVLVPGDDGRTAVYDITAHTVYLPSGRRLEAHSGLGNLMDNPRHVRLKMRGATPPNVYNLALRERVFHGVRAIRLKPVDEARMHGRDGILAHTYMLGSNGQSNGCVAFQNYPAFLDAYQKGEVSRLAVVERLESPPGKLAAGQLPEPVKELMKATDRSRQYAAADTR